MTDEQLIEEAAKAICEAQVEEATYGDLARAALAVFEERWSHTQTVNVNRSEWERLKAFEAAHAPTNDEREAAITAAYNAVTGNDDEVWNPDKTLTALNELWDSAAGLRRSVVPETSPDVYELTIDMLEDLLVTAGVAASEHGIAIRKTAGALVYRIGRRLAPEPQGEPSDAQVEVAARVLFGATVDSMLVARELAHIALRTASAVTEQGEADAVEE